MYELSQQCSKEHLILLCTVCLGNSATVLGLIIMVRIELNIRFPWLQDQIEDLQNQQERQKKELKKRKDRETNLQTEVDDAREELGKSWFCSSLVRDKCFCGRKLQVRGVLDNKLENFRLFPIKPNGKECKIGNSSGASLEKCTHSP